MTMQELKENSTDDQTRRRFLKTSAMAGAAATGLVGFSGTAAAQTLQITQVTGRLLPRDRALVESVQLLIEDATSEGITPEDIGDVTINIGNSLINVQDVDITVVGGDLVIDVDVRNVVVSVFAQICAVVAIIGEAELDECEPRIEDVTFVQRN